MYTKIKGLLKNKKAVYVTDILKDILTLNIAGHIFDEDKMRSNFFFNVAKDDQVIPLLKKVFQDKYPITRNNGMPKVPSDPNEKTLLIEILEAYFYKQREIIMKKHNANSTRADVPFRESINHLQKIKILIEHFSDSLDTFPYDKFQSYLDNKEFIHAQEDIEDTLTHLSSIKDEDKRIRNLLRQFAKIYMKHSKDSSFILNDPGLLTYASFNKDLETTYKNKIGRAHV